MEGVMMVTLGLNVKNISPIRSLDCDKNQQRYLGVRAEDTVNIVRH
jgi:hypothetical protein